MNLKKYFNNKKVLITGHTGFKGSWLSLYLLEKGAKVVGISDREVSIPSHYRSLKLKKKIKDNRINLKDLYKLKKIINFYKPDYIFHLAAQAIVKTSYENPLETWTSNTFGTLNLLESLKNIKKKTTVVLITSDKVYKNIEIKKGYKENDILGGEDPYSASKASTEILINSYIKSYFNKRSNSNVSIAIARAGNVIGGGDWSKGRLIPDCIKSWKKKNLVEIRNPFSTRPWQHVIEVVYGYIKLAAYLSKNNNLHGEAFNFGPSLNNNYRVIDIVKKMKKNWKNFNWKVLDSRKNLFKENKLLQLDSSKSKIKLNWKCKLDIDQTINLVSNWYKSYYKSPKSIYNLSVSQISFYEKLIKNIK